MTNNQLVKCTFNECNKYFKTVLEMKKHKKYASEHEYCHVCDIDFDDWDTAVMHKSQMSGMDAYKKTQKQYKKEKEQGVFWNNKEKFGKDYGDLKFHKYYCKFCGEAHHCESARQRHTLQFHPINQNIKCPACEQVFPRAAGLMYHLEEGYCKHISSVEFRGYLQHKGLVNRLLQNPDLLKQIADKDIRSYLESARDDATTGGVSLMDIKNSDIIWDGEAIEPLKPEVTPSMPKEQQTWPALTSAMNSLNVEAGSSQQNTTAWSEGGASKELFPMAKAAPATNEWQERQNAIHEEAHKSNILAFQFWNPASPDYDQNRFYDPVIEKHLCPFPNCDEWFDIQEDCQKHIAESHAIQKIRCPSCLKRFGAHHALIAHIENSSKCTLRHSRKFGEALDEISGGFLSHKVAMHPDLNGEEDGYDVGYIKYESAVPPGFDERAETVVSGTKN